MARLFSFPVDKSRQFICKNTIVAMKKLAVWKPSTHNAALSQQLCSVNVVVVLKQFGRAKDFPAIKQSF